MVGAELADGEANVPAKMIAIKLNGTTANTVRTDLNKFFLSPIVVSFLMRSLVCNSSVSCATGIAVRLCHDLSQDLLILLNWSDTDQPVHDLTVLKEQDGRD